jgi:HAD superfamily hydrolase (TIGR01509 family)
MPPSKGAVLFDLDETLVLTSSLEPLRKRRNWPAVYANFSQTALPPATLEFIAKLKALSGIEIGVVTKAPRSYAEKLLKFHEIDIPVLVAYHDVARQKPHPDSLIKAAERLNLSLKQCIYIGDHPDDLAAAGAAKCMAIAISWAGKPDTHDAYESWEAVYDRVTYMVEQLNG